MGAGRKTSTYNYDSLGAQQYWEQTQRNLGDAMGGVIFGEHHSHGSTGSLACYAKASFHLPIH